MSNIAISPDLHGLRFDDYRDEIWGDSYTWSFARSLEQVVKLAIHHSVTARNATADDIALLHKARGWGGIGYHFVITEDGTVWYVGDIGTARANIANHNEKIIGICLTGDFTKELQTQEQILATKYLCEYFFTQFPALVNINSWADVIGHQEAVTVFGNTTATACPGSNWKSAGDSFYERLKSGHVDGYPTVKLPQPEPTPEPAPTPPEPVPEPIPEPEPIPAPDEPSECDKKLTEVKKILWGKGFWWTKINKLKALLPK